MDIILRIVPRYGVLVIFKDEDGKEVFRSEFKKDLQQAMDHAIQTAARLGLKIQ